jgi:hypothetical protein
MDNPTKLATYSTQDTRRRQTNQQHNTICIGHRYAQTNTNNVNRTTGGKDELTSFLCGNRNGHHNTELRYKNRGDYRCPGERVNMICFCQGSYLFAMMN